MELLADNSVCLSCPHQRGRLRLLAGPLMLGGGGGKGMTSGKLEGLRPHERSCVSILTKVFLSSCW
jgi:hypothetical protein